MNEVSKLSAILTNMMNFGDGQIHAKEKFGVDLEWVDALPQGGVIVKTKKGVYKFTYEEVK